MIWYVHLRGDVYAMSVGRDTEFRSEQEVRTYMREWLGVKRLPVGTQIWKSRPWW